MPPGIDEQAVFADAVVAFLNRFQVEALHTDEDLDASVPKLGNENLRRYLRLTLGIGA